MNLITYFSCFSCYAFVDKISLKGPTQADFQSELSYFLFNINAVFCKMLIFMGYWWTKQIIRNLFWIGVLKRLKFWNFAYLKGKTNVKNKVCPANDCFQHINASNTILCPAIYYIKQNTVSTIVFDIHLSTFPCWHAEIYHALICETLYFRLTIKWVE